MKNIEICDCTLRDGGYYTNWDFDQSLVESYLQAMENLPIDIIEVGYRQKVTNRYAGEYFNVPVYRLKWIKQIAPSKKIAIMLNGAEINITNVQELIEPITPYIDIVRIAIRPQNICSTYQLIEYLNEKGLKVAANIMYFSNYVDDEKVIEEILTLSSKCDYINLVDSYGGMYPDKIGDFFKSFILKNKGNAIVGFHGHNNLQLVFANSLVAINSGCGIIDCTVTGMGRGAGNLETELLLTWLAAQKGVDVNYNKLSLVVDCFEELKVKYQWGTKLAYMVSGALSLPQEKVMDWVSKRFYSLNSIVQKLNNEKLHIEDNTKLPIFQAKKEIKTAIIVGGGGSVNSHKEAILKFIKLLGDEVCLIHPNSLNVGIFKEIKVQQFHIIMGNEGYRLQKVIEGYDEFDGLCVLPPFPRKMGTYVPEKFKNQTFELDTVDFNSKFSDSCTYVALKLALANKAQNIYTIGYDGYIGTLTQREVELRSENDEIFENFKKENIKLKSLTPTVYLNLEKHTIYSYIID